MRVVQIITNLTGGAAERATLKIASGLADRRHGFRIEINRRDARYLALHEEILAPARHDTHKRLAAWA